MTSGCFEVEVDRSGHRATGVRVGCFDNPQIVRLEYDTVVDLAADLEVKTLAHCGLVVRDLDKSCWFYREVIGLKEVSRPANFKFRGAWFRGGDSELHLILAEDTVAPAGFPSAGAAVRTGLATHIAFEVPDLTIVKSRLERYGIEIKGGPMLRGDGVLQLYLHDPDDYMLEFFQWVDGVTDHAPDRNIVTAS